MRPPPIKGAKALAEIETSDAERGSRYFLLDEKGILLYPEKGERPFSWDSLKLPREPGEMVPLEEAGGRGASIRSLVRLEGKPVQYLCMEFKPLASFSPKLPLLMLASLILSVLLGAWVALHVLFRSLRQSVGRVDEVMNELKRGNLKARIPVDRSDEIGEAMIRFNRMTDEIERLVERLKEVEKSRTTILQELAHDLRTPIASLKNLVETVQRKDDVLESAVRRELLDLAVNEIDYFDRLVEDLLVMAQIGEPQYMPDSQPALLNELLDEVVETVDHQFASQPKNIKLIKEIPEGDVKIRGNAYLLRRMLRNAIDNAYTYAHSEVRVVLRADAGEAKVLIEDDGPGLSPEAAASYGDRRVGRTLNRSKSNYLRVGLGAVILKNIVRAHQGIVKAGNRQGSGGKILGTAIEITLPIV